MADGAGAVLSLTAAGPSLQVARTLAEVLVPGQLYADLNTAAPALKLELAAVVVPSGALFVDGALMGPVPGQGMRTPCLACGPGAAGFAELLRPLGMPVVVLGGEPGEAATRKLLRSVFMKGLAAAAIESLAAARAAGCEAWLYAEIAETFEGAGTALLERAGHCQSPACGEAGAGDGRGAPRCSATWGCRRACRRPRRVG